MIARSWRKWARVAARVDGGDGARHEAPAGFPAEMQFGTLDLAGNFSGWGQTQRFSPQTASGCDVAGPGVEPPYRPLSPLIGAVFGMLAVRRARRGRRRSCSRAR
jgi:hypothetical protein